MFIIFQKGMIRSLLLSRVIIQPSPCPLRSHTTSVLARAPLYRSLLDFNFPNVPKPLCHSFIKGLNFNFPKFYVIGSMYFITSVEYFIHIYDKNSWCISGLLHRLCHSKMRLEFASIFVDCMYANACDGKLLLAKNSN